MTSNECWCGAKANSRCSACKREYFCSRNHQEEIWKFHKLNCKDIDTPIFIRQPKLTFEEFNTLQILVSMDPIEREDNGWMSLTDRQKQVGFKTGNAEIEKIPELERHELLINNRVILVQALMEQGASPLNIIRSQPGFFPFYSIASLEDQMKEFKNPSPTTMNGFGGKDGIFPIEFQKVFKGFFIYSFWSIGGGGLNGKEDNFKHFRIPARDRLLRDVIVLENTNVRGCKVLGNWIRNTLV